MVKMPKIAQVRPTRLERDAKWRDCT
jgi:hypothetical protein